MYQNKKMAGAGTPALAAIQGHLLRRKESAVKQFFGTSHSGNLSEAVRGLQQPQLLILMSNSEQFEAHVKELEKRYPGVPSIGCVGMCYDFLAYHLANVLLQRRPGECH